MRGTRTKSKCFLVIQEGGTSDELYAHGFDTRAAARRYRRNCETDGAYRTSEVLEVPRTLMDHPDFMEVAEAIAGASISVDFPS